MPKKKYTRQNKYFHLFFQILLGVFDVLVSIILAFFLTFIYFYTNTTEVTDKKFEMNEASIVYDRNGTHILYKIFGEENRKVIPHNDIPNVMRWATIATEDNNFYNHFGIDLKSNIRAIKANLKADEIEQGASTITQQLARSVFLTREKTFKRKIKEAVLAIKIERSYSKDEILDMYLNKVPYGANAYGIQSAAQTYFNKDAKDLTLDEATLLAVLPNAPTFYLPYGENLNEVIKKQKNIIKRTHELGLIDKKIAVQALQEDTSAKIKPLNRDIKAPHFVMYVLNEMEKKYGRDFLEKGGLKIITSLDWEKQVMAEKILKESHKHLNGYGASNSSLVAIDPRTGQILTMVGSIDFFDESIDGQVNVSIRERQPGSSFKPIVYAKAFEKEFQPETLLYDTSTNFGPDGSGSNYIPQNYDGKFHGRVSMRQALAMSLNIPAVKTLYLAGIQETIELAERLGITTLTDKQNYGLALALGGGSIKLLEEVSAFSVFANDGKKNDLASVLSIHKSNGKEISAFSKKEQQAMSSEIARKINSILSDNESRIPTFGSNNPLRINGYTVAAKTGTTQDYRDAWTVGYTPSLAVGVWAGNNNNHPMRLGAAGTFVAGPIWNKFMSQTLVDYPKEQFIAYQQVSKNIPMISGDSKLNKTTIYYNINTGKKISASKAKKTDKDKVAEQVELEKHSLLYYLAESTNIDSEMLKRWEESINSYPELEIK